VFASLPKLFDKNLIIGFLLPVLLALAAAAWLFPAIGMLQPLRSLSAESKTLDKLAYLLLLAYAFAILLMMTNTPQYRFLEGYLWPVSKLKPLKERQDRRRRAISEQLAVLDHADDPDQRALADRLARRLVEEFPPLNQAVMPTSFGNVIRAFESYPLVTYGVDGVPAWTRLASVVPEEFAAGLEDARAQVNFLVNLLYLMIPFGVAALCRAAAETPWPLVWRAAAHGDILDWRPSAAAIAGAALVVGAWPTYRFAVTRAAAWGDVVKAAFDCYLPALVTQLGYALPATDGERRALWVELNALFVYWQPLNPARYRYAEAAAAKPKSVLASLRGLFKRRAADDASDDDDND
jgi:hypothetical protein